MRPIDDISIHYRHHSHEIGDVHPYFLEDGRLYMYYLKPGGKYDVALLVSSDMLQYEEAAVQLLEDDSKPAIKPWFVLGIFYDEHKGVYRSYSGTDGNRMRSAYSVNLHEWKAADERYDIPRQEGYTVQRDPFVIWNEEDGQYWAVMTCRRGGDQSGPGGSVGYAVSSDLQTWTGMGDLYAPGNIGDPEVPQLFKFGNKWYLIFSVYHHRVGTTTCLVSDSASGPWREENVQLLDGEDFAAAQVAIDYTGRLMLFGWIPLRDTETIGEQHWGGDIAFPRELLQRPNGRFDVRLPTDIEQALRGETILLPDDLPVIASDEGEKVVNLPHAHNRFGLQFSWQRGQSQISGGIRVTSEAAHDPVTVELDISAGKLTIFTGSHIHSELAVSLADEQWIQFHLIIEDDIAELFINGRYSLAARLMSRVSNATLQLYERGNSGTDHTHFEHIQLYGLKTKQELSSAFHI